MKKRTIVGMVSILSAIVVWASQGVSHAGATEVKLNPVPKAGEAMTVMAIGGSTAAGWGDDSGGGYLSRAFETLSNSKQVRYNFINKSVAGCGPLQYLDGFAQLLQETHPQMLVISFGFMEDMDKNTSMTTFRQALQSEIAQALADHEIVVVVSPPITRASYTDFVNLEPEYVKTEFEVAQSFHSPNVYTFDVFNQMKVYLIQHHQGYARYMKDGWHPNSAGHILAAQLLVQDMTQQFFQ
jgi:acyl-CoA thioesterase I